MKPDEARTSDSSANNAGYMGHPNPVTSQGHTPTFESSPGLVTDPTRDISLGSTNFSSISVVSLNTHPKFSHHVSSSQSDTAACLQDAGATPMPEGSVAHSIYMQSPPVLHNYISPIIISSSARLQTYLERTRHPTQGASGTPIQNMTETRHERKRLDIGQGNSMSNNPPKIARLTHFPGQEDSNETAGNRIGSSLSRVTPDPNQPRIG